MNGGGNLCDLGGKRRLINVHADSDHGKTKLLCIRRNLREDSAHFFTPDQQIVRPAKIAPNSAVTQNRIVNGHACHQREPKRLRSFNSWTQEDRCQDRRARLRLPRMPAPPSTCGLLVGEEHVSFFYTGSACMHRQCIGGSRFGNVVKLAREKRSVERGFELGYVVIARRYAHDYRLSTQARSADFSRICRAAANSSIMIVWSRSGPVEIIPMRAPVLSSRYFM